MHDEVRTRETEQLDETSDRRFDSERIDPPFVASRRFTAQGQALHALHDADGLEIRGFESDGRRRLTDLGVLTSHDPGDADGAVIGITDEQIVGGEAALDSVESDHRLTVTRHTNAEASSTQSVEVVGVIGLIRLEHHVIADVDHIVDRSHSRRSQTALHPVR